MILPSTPNPDAVARTAVDLHKRLGGQAPLRFDQLPFAEGDAA